MQQSTVLVMTLHTCQSLEGNHTLTITKTVVPLAIFCAVSRIVIAAGYARPLTADINGVMPLASLGKKTPNKLKYWILSLWQETQNANTWKKLNTADLVQTEKPQSE